MRRALPTLVLAAALAALLSCDKDEPTKPQPAIPLAQIETIWPNEDGKGWEYHYVLEEWQDTSSVGLFPNSMMVPQAPNLSTMGSFFATHQKGDSVQADSGAYAIQFRGDVTTASGVTAQHLTERLVPLFVGPESFAPAGRVDPLLMWIWQARPDLRPRIESMTGARPRIDVPLSGPLFISGYAWQKKSTAIVGYGDVDTFPSWTYLKADIVAGSTFTHHLVPTLANDIYLHGRVVGRRSVTTPSGTYPNAIQVDYLVDYGVSEERDDQGNFIGADRQVSFGSVAYVDSVGPVACTERHGMRVGRNGKFSNGLGGGVARLLTTLVAIVPHGDGSDPSIAWGRGGNKSR